MHLPPTACTVICWPRLKISSSLMTTLNIVCNCSGPRRLSCHSGPQRLQTSSPCVKALKNSENIAELLPYLHTRQLCPLRPESQEVKQAAYCAGLGIRVERYVHTRHACHASWTAGEDVEHPWPSTTTLNLHVRREGLRHQFLLAMMLNIHAHRNDVKHPCSLATNFKLARSWEMTLNINAPVALRVLSVEDDVENCPNVQTHGLCPP